jgi:hypothetical protein
MIEEKEAAQKPTRKPVREPTQKQSKVPPPRTMVTAAALLSA